MIRPRGHLTCQSAEKAAALRRYVPQHIAAASAEPGRLSVDVTPFHDPLTFEVMGTFRTRADYDAHQARTRAGPWFVATRKILRDFRIEELRD